VSRKREVDARGLSCPQPVVLAQRALAASAAGDIIEVLVDNVAACENVSRFAKSKGCRVETGLPADGARNGDDDCYVVKITVGGRP